MPRAGGTRVRTPCMAHTVLSSAIALHQNIHGTTIGLPSRRNEIGN
jgi:hypothetical protein